MIVIFKCSLFLWKVVAGLRKKLDLNPVDGLDGNCQVLVLSAFHSGALSSKKLADIWLKAISSTCSPSELGPLDVVILLLLHSFIPGLKKQIQNVLRNRIKAGIISEALIEKTFTVFLAVCICIYVRNRSIWIENRCLWGCDSVSGQVVTAVLKDFGAFIFRVKQSKKNLEN